MCVTARIVTDFDLRLTVRSVFAVFVVCRFSKHRNPKRSSSRDSDLI